VHRTEIGDIVKQPAKGPDPFRRQYGHGTTTEVAMGQFHDFEMTSIDGDQVSFDRYDGQVALVVNVASQ